MPLPAVEVSPIDRTYICIDLKSYYASVECVARGLDPLKAFLLVSDESRTDKGICLAVSPALKAIGVGSRPRLFEAKSAIRDYEAAHHTHVPYIVAMPRMNEYIRVSSRIVEIYYKYVAPEDLHVYSIDECLIDVTPYLHLYSPPPGMSAAHYMAQIMIRDVLSSTGITATVGIGTNMYLAKVAMDILAKKAKPDEYGVRIAELDERSYRILLWDHQPMTDFWMIGPATAKRLAKYGVVSMGGLARYSIACTELLYKMFGVNAQLLIDRAWGVDPCTMQQIHAYETQSHSLSSGQVLFHPTPVSDARLIFSEMIDGLCTQLADKRLQARRFDYYVSFDPKSLDVCHYYGPLSIDYYGRLHPSHVGGTVRVFSRSSNFLKIAPAVLADFDRKVDTRLLVRRLGIAATDVQDAASALQLDCFTDFTAEEKDRRLQDAIAAIRHKYGTNTILKGINLCEAGTARERNLQVGGHRG